MGVPDPENLYEQDFYSWAQDQAARLRAMSGDNRLDIEHLADEVADLGRSELNKVAEHLTQLVAHLLVLAWLDDPPPARQWRAQILNHQRQARRAFTPGMRRHLDGDDIWAEAARLADAKLRDAGDPALPAAVPAVLSVEILLDPNFDVERAAQQVASTLGRDGESGGV